MDEVHGEVMVEDVGVENTVVWTDGDTEETDWLAANGVDAAASLEGTVCLVTGEVS